MDTRSQYMKSHKINRILAAASGGMPNAANGCHYPKTEGRLDNTICYAYRQGSKLGGDCTGM